MASSRMQVFPASPAKLIDVVKLFRGCLKQYLKNEKRISKWRMLQDVVSVEMNQHIM